MKLTKEQCEYVNSEKAKLANRIMEIKELPYYEGKMSDVILAAAKLESVILTIELHNIAVNAELKKSMDIYYEE